MALCVLLAGCGSRGYRVGAPAGDDAMECDGAETGPAAAQALLRVGCDGELLPGRAVWSVDSGVVTLEFGAEAAVRGGPVGAELVRTWAPLHDPPWLGHRVQGISVEGDRVRVEFAADSDEPERLFADLRLSGARATAVAGDARDAIDAGDAEVVTFHDASIEYARSLGRGVRRMAWDRLYLAVFAGDASAAQARWLAAQVARDWVAWGAPGARRTPSLRWAAVAERCGGDGGGTAGGVSPGPGGPLPPGRGLDTQPGPPPTVSYPEGDPAARQLAERMVSAAMRGGEEAEAVVQLTGGAQRPAVRAASGDGALRAPTDVAAVLVVPAGPGHPCSTHAEVLRATAAWGAADGPSRARVLLIGAAASFLVDKEAVR